MHPKGGYYSDSDRATGVFGVLATGFSVLLGFLIFFGFESYDASRRGAETEALTVAQQVQTAQLLPADVGEELTGELVCYARSVIHGEWTAWRTARSARTSTRGVWRCSGRCKASSCLPRRRRLRKWLDQTSAAKPPARTASTVPPG